MLWKSRPKNNNRAKNLDTSDFYSRLKDDIPVMRKQGEPPEKDPSSFSRFYCDLCNDSFPLSELKQCTLCGRWACTSCWTPEYYLCNSCNGILKLHMLPQQEGARKKT
ncbi:MAG: hypothetical protein APR55_07585 [Methanolinea sp. SDB]|nr:MAG: hypothetical protein APR55_07585 [Methanolinea sp. SDB]